jgi:DNA-binding SARP family transcriptional activator
VLRLITLGRLQLIRDGPLSESIHVQPKRLALLAYLALVAREGFQHRDTLLALFWPQSNQRRARRCLRQALFHLRNTLGDGVIVNAGKEGVALAAGRLWCDAVALEGALRARRAREAVIRYGGDFLPGVFVDECSGELEAWVQRTRERLRSRVAAAAWALVDEHLREGRSDAALEAARRARSISPDDEHGLRRHMVILGTLGDRAAALGAYAEFSRRFRQEFDAEPSWESRQLYQALRLSGGPPDEVRPLEPSRCGRGAPTGVGPSFPTRPSGRGRGSVWAAGIAVVAAFVLAGFVHDGGLPRHKAWTAGRHLLLTEFTNHTRDSLLGAAVTEALRADLSQIAEVRLRGQPADPGSPAGVPGTETVLVVTGDIAALGPGFSVSARLLSARTGRVLSVLRENAVDSNYLLRAVERLSRRLRTDVTHSLAPALEDAMRGRLSTSYW